MAVRTFCEYSVLASEDKNANLSENNSVELIETLLHFIGLLFPTSLINERQPAFKFKVCR